MSKIQRGVTKSQWFEAALATLKDGAISDIAVEKLSKTLGVAKAGFYWHFKNRDDLLYQLLNYWIHETTEVISENPVIQELEPKLRLIAIAEMIFKFNFAQYDPAFRQWAQKDAIAARGVRKVNRIRLSFVRTAFSELGFKGKDLEMRTMLFICYQGSEQFMFSEISRKKRRELIARRVDLLTKK